MAESILLFKQRFVKPNEINRYLYCPICIDVFKNPMRLFCGHTFCEKCVFEWLKTYPVCPECRETIDENLIGKDLVADNLIQDLEVYCPSQSCGWKQDLRNLSLHFQNCQYKGQGELQNGNEAGSYYELEDANLSKNDYNQMGVETYNLKTKPLEQYHDLLHCIEEFSFIHEEHQKDLLNQKQNCLSDLFPPYQTPKVICKQNLKTGERKKKRRHKGGEFDRETDHILKKSKVVN